MTMAGLVWTSTEEGGDGCILRLSFILKAYRLYHIRTTLKSLGKSFSQKVKSQSKSVFCLFMIIL